MNPECQAKHVKSFALFVSRDALNIEGLSEATLEKFISRGYIHTFADIFHLDQYKEKIQKMEGFGEKSYKKLTESIEKARTTTLPRVIYSLGIAGIGLANAKVICRELKYDVESLLKVSEEELNEIQGVGEVLAKAFVGYFADAKHVENFRRLLNELTIPEETVTKQQIFEGVNFVITGSVKHFANRGEVKELIESLGGKVTGSVTSKTNYLINNDVTSTSSKNKKANELGIPIISEETFLELVNQGKHKSRIKVGVKCVNYVKKERIMANQDDNNNQEIEKVEDVEVETTKNTSDTDNKKQNNDDGYEKVCFICRRPESVAGKMIELPNHICVCNDCMQKSFDAMSNGPIDYSQLMNIPGVQVFNMADMEQSIPNQQKIKKEKKRGRRI